MPKYLYKCILCEVELEVYHLMSETKENCEICDTTGTLKKIPSNFRLVPTIKKPKKVGSMVDASIKEFRQELEQEKHKLKNEFYKSDD